MPAGDFPLQSNDQTMHAKSAAATEALGAAEEGVLSVAPFAGITSQFDSTANDSDKTFTVPAGKVWEVLSIYATLTATATVGNRYLIVSFRDGSANIIAQIHGAAVQAANTLRRYSIHPGTGPPTEITGAYQSLPLPPSLWLPATYDIRIYDINAIDPAADDMSVGILYRELTP